MRISEHLAVIVLLSFSAGSFANERSAISENAPAASQELLAFAEEAATGLKGPEADQWMRRLEERHDILAADFERAVSAKNSERSLRLANALSSYWERKSQASHAREMLRRAIDLGRKNPPTAALAGALLKMGAFAFRQKDQADALDVSEEALAIYEAIGDQSGAADAHLHLARIALRDHNYSAVALHAGIAAAAYEGVGDRAGAAGARHMLAVSAEMRGELEEAAALYEELMKVQRVLGNPFQEAVEQYNLASVHLKMGDVDQAERMLCASLVRSLSVGDDVAAPYALLRYAGLSLARSNNERAAKLLGAANAAFEDSEISLDPAEQADFENYRTALREVLGQVAFEKAFSAGRELEINAALALAGFVAHPVKAPRRPASQ